MSRKNLTDKAIRALATGELVDGKTPGLCVRARNGRKYWSYRYSAGAGRRPRVNLGTYPEVSLKLARQLARQFGAVVATGGDPAQERDDLASETTVAELWARAMQDHWKVRSKPSTVRSVEGIFRCHVGEQLGRLRVSELTRKRVIVWHQKIGKTSPGAANRALAHLSKAMSLAVDWELTDANPCRRIPKFKERKIERYLTVEELKRLRAVTDEMHGEGFYEPALAFVWWLIFTGMRSGEALGMRWKDINTKTGAVHLRDSKVGERWVPMRPEAFGVIDNLKRRCEWVFPKQNRDEPIKNPWAYWLRIRARAGIEDVRIHDLRHTHGTHLAANGVPLHIVKSILGHSTIVTTQRYLHASKDQELEAMGVIVDVVDGD